MAKQVQGGAKPQGAKGQDARAPGARAQAPRQRGSINLLRLSTIIAVAILVGTEVVGASWAAGWALGGMLHLPPLISRGFEIVFGLSGFVLLYFFMRVALRHEPVRD